MKIPITTGGGPLTIYRANTYRAELTRIEDAGPSPFNPDREQLKLYWHLVEVPDGENGPAIFSHWVNKSAHEASTLMTIAATILQTDVEDLVANAGDLDTDELIGGQCRLVLTIEKSQKGQDVNRVKAYLPFEDAPVEAPAAGPARQAPGAVRPTARPFQRTVPAATGNVPF